VLPGYGACIKTGGRLMAARFSQCKNRANPFNLPAAAIFIWGDMALASARRAAKQCLQNNVCKTMFAKQCLQNNVCKTMFE